MKLPAQFLLLSFFSVSFCCNTNDITIKQKEINTSADTIYGPESQSYTIYLSFDDGPLEGSEEINTAVLQEKIKINVFVVGIHTKANKRLGAFYDSYLKNPFIEVGNHSYSHAGNKYRKFYQHPQEVLKDFLKCQQELNIPYKIARQPGRNQWRLKDTVINDVRSGAASADSLFKEGFKVFGWDIEWRHHKKTGLPVQTADEMIKKIELLLKNGKTVRKNHLILLAHDEMFRKSWAESELKKLIDQLKAKGYYTFEHLSSYPNNKIKFK